MIGRTVSHYRILSHVGAGGMGTVYLAEDTKLQRRVAMKFLPADAARSREASARLVREARAASALDHPNIGTIYEIDEADGQPFIVMAYYEGETLATRLARGPLPIAEVARVVAQVADALDAAHRAGIVHRDLKPSNLMLTAAGHVKVLDFGIAMFSSAETETMARLTGAGTAVGTAAYMSPEQAAGEDVDARSDLWSLGVVVREMLTGRLPFEGTNALAVMHAVRTAPMPPIRSLRPDVAPELDEIVSRAMVRERHDRSISAAEIRDLAASCLARLSSGASPIAPVRPSSRRARVAVGAVVLLCAVGLAAWWVHRTAKVRWAREQAMPEIIKLAGDDRFDDAYRLAQEAEQYIPEDPVLGEQLRAISRTGPVESVPAGAQVSYRPYGRTEEPWRPLGRTPVKNVSVPRGLLQWKAELAGVRRCRRRRSRYRSGPLASRSGSSRPERRRPGWSGSCRRTSLSTVHPRARSSAAGQSGGLLDRSARGHQSRVQAVSWTPVGTRAADLWREPFVKDGRSIAFVGGDGASGRQHWTTGARHLGTGRLSGRAGRLPSGRRQLVRSSRRLRAGPASRCRRSTTGAARPISG